MDMSNKDITLKIVEIIQPFFEDDDQHSPNVINVLSDEVEPIDVIPIPALSPIPVSNSDPTPVNAPESDLISKKNPKIGIEIKRRNAIPSLTPELISTLIGGGLPPSILTTLGFSSSSFSQPIIEEATEPVNENTLYCDQCSFHTNDQICMMDHTLIYHDGAFNEYACDRCNAYFSSMHELDEHISILHPKKTLKKEIGSKNINKVEENKSTETQVMAEGDGDEDEEPPLEEPPPMEIEKKKDLPFKSILPKMKIINADNPPQSLESDDDEQPPVILSPEEIAKQNLHKWSSVLGKYQCQICGLKFRSQNHLGEHFMLNHHTYEEQLELDQKINTTSFPGFEVLSEIEYCSFPENNDYYEECCQICCEQYLVNHDKRIKIVNSSYLDEYDGETLYPVIVHCCKDNHTCHKCLSGYLNSSYLNGMLYCPFCQQDKTRYGLKYLSITDIQCNKTLWQQWWSKENRIDILANAKYSLC
jgi:hypothetical protein